MIASNISAEQFIGTSGAGFTQGLAVAAYEWVAAIVLIFVAVFFMPIYLRQKIYTMPQFLEQRYNCHAEPDYEHFLAVSVRGREPDRDSVPGRAGHQQPGRQRRRRQLPPDSGGAGRVCALSSRSAA